MARRGSSAVAGRFVALVIKYTILLAFIAGVLLLTFFISMDVANIKQIISDGLDYRAKVILEYENKDDLGKYFTKGFIDTDTIELQQQSYSNYDIRGNYNHKAKITKVWVWPWQLSVSCEITEQVLDLQGDLLPGKEGQNVQPPKWPNGRYRVFLEKINGSWKIDRMELIASIEGESEVPVTPTPQLTASPTPTSQPSTPTAVPAGTYGKIKTSDGGTVNVRDRAAIEGAVVTNLSDGTRVEIIGTENGWYKIKMMNVQGYVRQDFIELED